MKARSNVCTRLIPMNGLDTIHLLNRLWTVIGRCQRVVDDGRPNNWKDRVCAGASRHDSALDQGHFLPEPPHLLPEIDLTIINYMSVIFDETRRILS